MGYTEEQDYGISTANGDTQIPDVSSSLVPFYGYDSQHLHHFSKPEFIFSEGKPQPRYFELARSRIGTAVIIGSTIGSLAGFYNGLAAIKKNPMSKSLQRTQILNHMVKQGSATANSLGTITLIYSGFSISLGLLLQTEDNLNTLMAGVATGMAMKMNAGARKLLMGGAVGLGLSTIYCLGSILIKGRQLRNEIRYDNADTIKTGWGI